MLLREFITTTLTDIVQGIVDAQAKSMEKGAVIAPDTDSVGGKAGADFASVGGHHHALHSVQFDIAVVAENRGEAGTSAGISVLSIDLLKAGAKTQRGETHTSRISFTVPVIYPAADVTKLLQARTDARPKYVHPDPYGGFK